MSNYKILKKIKYAGKNLSGLEIFISNNDKGYYEIETLYDKMKSNLKFTGSYTINTIKNGEKIDEYYVDFDNYENSLSKWWRGEGRTHYLFSSPNIPIWTNDGFIDEDLENENVVFQISRFNSITQTQNYEQSYLKSDNINYNCLWSPILNHFNKIKSRDAEAIRNHIKGKQLKNKYKEGLLDKFKLGTKEEDIKFYSEKLHIEINIYNVKNEKIKSFKPEKRIIKKFDFVNSRLDHLEQNIGIKNLYYLNEKKQVLPRSEIKKIFDNQTNTDFIFKQNKNGIITHLNDNTGTYTAEEDKKFHDTIEDMNKKYGLDEISYDRFKYKELDNYIDNSLLTNATVDFENVNNWKNKLNELKHLDMKKAYTNFYQSKYYNGFLGKITNFKKMSFKTYIQHTKQGYKGLYMINKLNFSNSNDKFKYFNKIMKCYKNYNIYTDNELKFLTDNKVYFNVILGAVGTNIKWKYTNEMINEKIDNIAYYKKHYGCLLVKSKSTNYYQLGDKKYFENVLSNVKYNDKYNKAVIKIPKKTDKSKTHIASFILSYMRLNMYEMLFKLYDSGNKIIRVCVDGIYYEGDKINVNDNLWSYKEKKTLENEGSKFGYIPYLNNNYNKNQDYLDMLEYVGEDTNLYFTNEYEGEGGTGKTYKLLNSKGLINSLYLTHSWILSNKQKTDKVNNSVHHRLLDKNHRDHKKIKLYSNYFIDEKSMLLEQNKIDILNTFKGNIYFIGDNKQLPPVKEGKPYIVGKDIQKTNIIESKFENNYRITDRKLYDILQVLRDKIHNKEKYDPEFINTLNFQEVKGKDILNKYDYKNDVILSPLKDNHKLDQYIIKNTMKFKYRVNRNYPLNNLYNGSIVYDIKPLGLDFTLSHTHTIHETQGLTFKNNILLYNIGKIYSYKMLYTALSRGKEFNNIYLIK